jgi:hypothetical protein
MLQPKTYRGLIPFELYVELSNKLPQRLGENDQQWVTRIKQDPTFAQKMFSTGRFKMELMQAVQRREMAQAGAKRIGQQQAGPALIKLSKPGDAGAKTTMASRYIDEFMVKGDPTKYKYAQGAYDLLLEQFNAATPINGSIFWNGINELALAKLVDQWNSELGAETFGQLEATTAARYVNKQFVWEDGAFKNYFTTVSDRLGHEAKGHVTSVVRCGLRFDSIFTVTELPRMLTMMQDNIKRRQAPVVTDLTIVVIQPKMEGNRGVAAFTNLDIQDIPIVRPKAWRINGPDDCTVDGKVQLNFAVRDYWTARGKKSHSAAALKIMKDYTTLIKWP